VDTITPEETVWIKDSSVIGIAIQDFMNEPTRVTPENPRFHAQLMHVRECLDQAVLRNVYNIAYDGEAKVNAADVARGAREFEAAMYGM
jgi:hypothetical protein